MFFVLYPGPLAHSFLSPLGQYLKLYGQFCFPPCLPCPFLHLAYLPEGGEKGVLPIGFSYPGAFQVSFCLPPRGGGSWWEQTVLLMTVVWGWQGEGVSLGLLFCLLLQSFGKLHLFKLVFPRDLGC